MISKDCIINLTLVFIIALWTVTCFVPEKAGGVTGATLYVGGNGQENRTTIQSAINSANDGDTVYVYSGTYYENVVMYKTINLIGENKNTTVIDGANIGDVINISADGTNLRGFTLQNGNKGIYLWSSSNNAITGNTITNNFIGIDFYSLGSIGNTIRGNTITKNDYGIAISGLIFPFSGNKIYQNNLISNSIHAATSISGGTNISWDNGYPTGGNYWDTYVGSDANGDDIGDVPYYVPGGDNLDRYPLMMPYTRTINNQLPLANFTYSSNALFVTFIDTSTDPDGNITLWHWDFGDQNFSTASSPTHEYKEEGDYMVNLIVTDDDNETNSMSYTITVENGDDGGAIPGFEMVLLVIALISLLMVVWKKR